MRATRMAAALTAALVLTPVATASATAVGNGAAAPGISPVSITVPVLPGLPGLPGMSALSAVPAAPARPADVPLPVTVPPADAPALPELPELPELPAAAELPALPELPATPDPSALLGTVGSLVDTATGLVSSLTSALPLDVVQQLLGSLQAVLQGLLGQLPTPPVTVPSPPARPGTAAPGRADTTTPALSEQLDSLKSLKAQAQSLAGAAAARPGAVPHRPAAG
ncbi:hypothetical protein [Kitasatospora sp. NPDC047058]|uniref:hypothetical protein n=1 Tax=Kitasatospora sp. NPDC047058 TaxID=3155620 RepID=UPI00340FB699